MVLNAGCRRNESSQPRPPPLERTAATGVAKQDNASAIDALLNALAGLNTGQAATRTLVPLPPATQPGSWGRALGAGILIGCRDRTRDASASAQPRRLRPEDVGHEGHRSIAELATLLWHTGGGADEAPELAAWLPAPHADPLVALSLPRRRLSEYRHPEPIARGLALPGRRVWIFEIERARGETPDAVALWRSRGAQAGWQVRCAALWTHGRIGSPTNPFVIGAQWDAQGGEASAAGCIIGPPAQEAARDRTEARRSRTIHRLANALADDVLGPIVVPAALAWLDAHHGEAAPAGGFERRETEKAAQLPGRGRVLRTARAPARSGAPAWLGAKPPRAVEALVLRTAGEGWRMGASCRVAQWRGGWAGHAEMGAVVWHAVGDLATPTTARRWRALEAACRESRLEPHSASPALGAVSALVRKMLVQTERAYVAPAPDDRPLCALEIPARLWRALAEAGPCPDGPPQAELRDRWWLVEIERPAPDEPHAIALWDRDGTEVGLAVFDVGAHGGADWTLSVVSWERTPDGAIATSAVAVLTYPARVDDPADAERQAAKQTVIGLLTAAGTGPVARAKTAIGLHLANGGAATPLAPYRPSTGTGNGARERATPGRGPGALPALFALERAPEPVQAAQAPARPGSKSKTPKPAPGAAARARALEAPGLGPEARAAALDRRRRLRARAQSRTRPDRDHASCGA